MKFEKFVEKVSEAVTLQIPENLRDVISVKVNEVVKSNDEALHGVTLFVTGENCMPTVYLEDCYADYKKGTSIEEIAKTIIRICAEGYKRAPDFTELSLEFDNVRDKLFVQLIDGDLNKERLKGLVHRPVGNGFVMIAHIVLGTDSEGFMRTAVTKDMALSYNYDEAEVMDRAFVNTMAKFNAVFAALGDFYNNKITAAETNLMEEDFYIDPCKGMYILTNRAFQDGACTLFYPGVAERVGKVLCENYYVLPSSIHEVIIVPIGAGFKVEELKNMVIDANRTVVEKKDILSEKVLLYDRKKNVLTEQK